MPYLDNFNVAGSALKIRDIEAREIINNVLGTISGNSGSSDKPIFLENGTFKECGDVLNVNISGNADSATNANHAVSADSATEANHALTADSSTNANHAVSADNATNANHAVSADNATEANHALSADNATEANHALSADNASASNSATNANTATKLSTSAGNSTTPIYFSSGIPTVCGSTLDVNISGTARSATEASKADYATNATNATTATALASSAGSTTKPIYFNGGKPVQCGSSLDVSITGNAGSSGARNVISNETLHVYTCTNGTIKTMDGYTEAKAYNITIAYGGLYYANVTINLPTYFDWLMCVNVTCQGPQACYFQVTSFNEKQINGFLVCPINISVNLSLFLHIVGH